MLVMWVQSLGWQDPQEEEISALSSILAWEIPWTRKPGRLQSVESQMNQTRICDYTATITLKIIPPSYMFWILIAVYKPPKSTTAESSLLLLYLARLWGRDSDRVLQEWLAYLSLMKSDAGTGGTPMAESWLGPSLSLSVPLPPQDCLNGLSHDMLTSGWSDFLP